jgi:ethanolamine utilization protein EutN
MKIFEVEGTLVATARIPGLELHRLLVVRDRKGSKQVAVDPVGCKPGDWVIACGSSAAREAAGHKDYPSDLTIVGIIDFWDEDDQERPGEERPEEPELVVVESPAPSGAGKARR